MDLEPRAVTYPPYVESERLRGNFTNSDPLIPVKNPHELRFDDLGALGTQLFVEFSAGLGDHERLDDGPQGDVGCRGVLGDSAAKAVACQWLRSNEVASR